MNSHCPIVGLSGAYNKSPTLYTSGAVVEVSTNSYLLAVSVALRGVVARCHNCGRGHGRVRIQDAFSRMVCAEAVLVCIRKVLRQGGGVVR